MTFASLEDLLLQTRKDLTHAEAAVFAARWHIAPMAIAARPPAFAVVCRLGTDGNPGWDPDDATHQVKSAVATTDAVAVAPVTRPGNVGASGPVGPVVRRVDFDALERTVELGKLRLYTLISWINLTGYDAASDILAATTINRCRGMVAGPPLAADGSTAAIAP